MTRTPIFYKFLFPIVGICLYACTIPQSNSDIDIITVDSEIGIDSSMCRHETIVLRDTIVIERTIVHRIYRDIVTINADGSELHKFVLAPQMLDSLRTQDLMEQTLWKGYIDIKNNRRGSQPELYLNPSLDYLPYFMQNYSYPDMIPRDQYNISERFLSLCSNTLNDSVLFLYGKGFVDNWEKAELDTICKNQKAKYRHFRDFSYPIENHNIIPSFVDIREYHINHIDSLRVKTLLYNDRNSLAKLEKYYRRIGYPKGIAIYYQVLMNYDGNGDLAERFYKILEPYFDETPEFRKAVREALLKAALCDDNQRAQQLCDSLGISICDYRMNHCITK